MPLLPDPTDVRLRPASVALGELAIAAGLVGESVTIACEFPASTLCLVWKYYSQTLGAESVIHVRAKRDLKNFDDRVARIRAVFVHVPRLYQEVAWTIQLAGTANMSPRPAVFCSVYDNEPDADPGLTLALTSDELEVAAIHTWAAGLAGCHSVEAPFPSGVEYEGRLESVLRSPSSSSIGLGFREQRIVEALIEGAALLRSTDNQEGDSLLTTLDDYQFVRRLLCSPTVRPNRQFCEPLAAEMIHRANVYLSVKLGSDRRNPFRVDDDEAYRPSRTSLLKRDAITRRELADLGNVHSKVIVALVEYLQRSDDGYERYLQMGCSGEPIPQSRWRHLPARDLARRLKPWSLKQVRTHFDRLHRLGLITADREKANGPLRYQLPEELESVGSPYSQLPIAQSLAQNHNTA